MKLKRLKIITRNYRLTHLINNNISADQANSAPALNLQSAAGISCVIQKSRLWRTITSIILSLTENLHCLKNNQKSN